VGVASAAGLDGDQAFDVLVLGAGWGGLVTATLLAQQGQRVCVLEAQDRAGGCGQSFTQAGFSFCAEMQYLMGCGDGGVVDTWLRAVGLHDEVTFNAFDPEGYDRVDFPGSSFRIPRGAARLQAALEQTFPDERTQIDALFAVLFSIEAEVAGRHFDARALLLHPFAFKDALLYGPWPAERVFDHFGLSPRLRAVLAGQCGDVGLGPRDAPFFALQAVLFGYCDSAHFPKKGMGHFVEAVVGAVLRAGGQVRYGATVERLEREGSRIARVCTSRGTFTAPIIVSNIDPAVTLSMVAGAAVPGYAQSASCFTLFLGVDEDLSARGFGRSNLWSFPSLALDAAIDRSVKEHHFDDPYFFLATPSLYADPGALAPPGSTTVQINVGASFEHFADAERSGTHPRERAHIVFQEAWSPVDLARHVGLAQGGMYGARLDFENRVLRRVSPMTAFDNLFLTGATAGGPGLQGAVVAGTRLVETLRRRHPS
jgi:all-trans-retinol 13,14-reductase